jgi:hypothetical protein
MVWQSLHAWLSAEVLLSPVGAQLSQAPAAAAVSQLAAAPVVDQRDHREILEDYEVELQQQLSISNSLLAYLKKERVITAEQMRVIQVLVFQCR